MVCLAEVGEYFVFTAAFLATQQEVLCVMFFTIAHFGYISLPGEKMLAKLSCACSVLAVFLEEVLIQFSICHK